MGVGMYEATLKNKAVEKCWAASSLSHVWNHFVRKSWMTPFLCYCLPCLMAGLEITVSRTCWRGSKYFSPVGRLSRERTRRILVRIIRLSRFIQRRALLWIQIREWIQLNLNTAASPKSPLAVASASGFVYGFAVLFLLSFSRRKSLSLSLNFIFFFLCKMEQTKELWRLIVQRRRLSHFTGYNEMF